MSKLHTVCLGALLTLSAQNVTADDLLSPDLSKFSLEGLMQVSIASKTPRAFKDIPGSVHVYTAEEIKRHGWLYLSEVVRDVPGVDLSDTGSGAFFTTRGVADSSAHGNKTIIMINGHNVGFPPTNSANFLGLQKDFNLASIKRVEILVGPGSTLHGANAFGMVIDLITYDPEDIDGIHTVVNYGSNQEAVGSVTASIGRGKLSGLFSGSIVDQRKVNLSEVPISATSGVENYDNDQFEDNFQKNYAFDGYVDYDRQIRFGFNIMHNDSGHGTVFLSTETGRRVFDKKMFYVDVNRKVTNHFEFKIKSHYLKADSVPEKIKQEFTGSSNSRGSANVGSESITTDGQLIYSISTGNTLLAGLFVERSRQRPVSGSFTSTGSDIPVPSAKPAQNWDNYATYLQWEWKPTQKSYAIAGVRYVDSFRQYESAILPQVGFNYSLSNDVLAKFNYQKGYRPPSAFEVGSTAAFLRPNPDLEPEYIDNYQVSVITRAWKKSEFQVTAFYSDITNLIKRIDTGDFIPTTTNPIFMDENVAEMHVKGFEFGVNTQLINTLGIKAVATYTDSHDSSVHYDTEPVVPYKFNLSLNWNIQPGWFLTVDGYWRVHPTTSPGNTIYQGKDAPSWLLMNANLRKERLFSMPHLAMNFTVRNVLNEKYSMIDRRGGSSNIPAAHPGELTNALLSVEYKFH